MTDETKLQKAIERQARAKAVLDSVEFQEAFAHLETLFVKEWKTCQDPVLRDELWRSQANLANLHKQLTTVISNGKLAQREIDVNDRIVRSGA